MKRNRSEDVANWKQWAAEAVGGEQQSERIPGKYRAGGVRNENEGIGAAIGWRRREVERGRA